MKRKMADGWRSLRSSYAHRQLPHVNTTVIGDRSVLAGLKYVCAVALLRVTDRCRYRMYSRLPRPLTPHSKTLSTT